MCTFIVHLIISIHFAKKKGRLPFPKMKLNLHSFSKSLKRSPDLLKIFLVPFFCLE
jgi:hypothetical protein